MSIKSLLGELKRRDDEIKKLELQLPFSQRLRRRYLTGRMFWATQICDTWGGLKMAVLMYFALGKQVFIALGHEYAWLVSPIKRGIDWSIDAFKTSVEFFHEVV